MQRTITYIVYFVVIALLQAFVFNNLNLSVYVYPMVYASFVLLLPIQTPHLATLLLGLFAGAVMDLAAGTAGLHTIASLASAFCRPLLLRLAVGKEEANEGGIPNANVLGGGRFLKYNAAFVLLHCFVFFSFEALTFEFFYLTLARIVLSTVVTVPLVYLAQMLIIVEGVRKKTRKA
jgi:rod shape-determining protein MreD